MSGPEGGTENFNWRDPEDVVEGLRLAMEREHFQQMDSGAASPSVASKSGNGLFSTRNILIAAFTAAAIAGVGLFAKRKFFPVSKKQKK